jgi:hypothetical protein
MNQSTHEEYEEVESPFASKSSDKSPHRERLRTRKNVFNRPFATDSTNAPTCAIAHIPPPDKYILYGNILIHYSIISFIF